MDNLNRRQMLGSLAILPLAGIAEEKETGKVHCGPATLEDTGPILKYTIGSAKYEILTYEIRDGEFKVLTHKVSWYDESINYTYECWYKGDKWHREDGPAFRGRKLDEIVFNEDWYLDGVHINHSICDDKGNRIYKQMSGQASIRQYKTELDIELT